jgi:hypothetical protein
MNCTIAEVNEISANALERAYKQVAIQAWKAAIGANILTIEQENEFVIWWNGWARSVK